jgi:hypothetical protein
MVNNQTKESLILGQKYAFATVSLILGICSYVNLLGLEKPILALVFGWLALRAKPEPQLTQHRVWAKTGVALASIVLVFVTLIVIFKFNEIRELIELLSKLDGGR